MTKPDLTPVTDADEAVEESIRRTLSRVRSRDAVTGEEQGSTGHSQRRWIVDPIDGTKNFVRGVPVWATLIALAVDDEVVLGVVSAPLLQRRWWASTGDGAWTGRSLLKATQCHVSDVRRLEDASLSYSSLQGWDERGQARRLRVADATGLADPRVRRLLVLHAARRGGGRHRRRARAGRARHGGAGRDRARGRRHASPRWTARTDRGAATRWPPTATCTTRRCRSWAPWRTTTATRTGDPSGPGSVSRAAAPRSAAGQRPGPFRRLRPGRESRVLNDPLFSAPSARYRRGSNGSGGRDEDRRSAQGQARSAAVITITPGRRRTRAARPARRAQRRRADRQHRRRDRRRASSASATSYATSTTTARSSTTPSARS